VLAWASVNIVDELHAMRPQDLADLERLEGDDDG
jgi:hypothetical protein